MNGNSGGVMRTVVPPIITGLISAGVALAAWTYFQAQSVDLLQYKVGKIEQHAQEQDAAILQLKDEVRNVNSLKLQMENNRAIIEVYGRRIERQEERK